MGIISVGFENNSIHISTTGLHKSRATEFCTWIQNNCASSISNTLHIDIPVRNNFMCFLHFSNIFNHLMYAV
jgi:hypothetical protein